MSLNLHSGTWSRCPTCGRPNPPVLQVCSGNNLMISWPCKNKTCPVRGQLTGYQELAVITPPIPFRPEEPYP